MRKEDQETRTTNAQKSHLKQLLELHQLFSVPGTGYNEFATGNILPKATVPGTGGRVGPYYGYHHKGLHRA